MRYKQGDIYREVHNSRAMLILGVYRDRGKASLYDLTANAQLDDLDIERLPEMRKISLKKLTEDEARNLKKYQEFMSDT